MNVTQFNQTIAHPPIKAPPDALVTILRHQDGEVLVEVEGKRVWASKRKHEPYTPTHKATEFQPNSNLSRSDLDLTPGAFKMLMWIRSLEVRQFSGRHAERELGMPHRTVRNVLSILKDAGKITVDTVPGMGYIVEEIKH